MLRPTLCSRSLHRGSIAALLLAAACGGSIFAGGPAGDSGPRDAGSEDAGESGTPDAGPGDAGAPDATPDAGTPDAGLSSDLCQPCPSARCAPGEYCVPSPGGDRVCTPGCDSAPCPDGFSCMSDSTGTLHGCFPPADGCHLR